ncbi:MAG: malonyl-ACP O-methyltransferase BioC [Geopsychrobacter sp.]|nr:malonyl-ACP O-methyltransferase BioC [Geopsychrobacter sp.]
MTLGEDSLKAEQIQRNFSRHAAEYDRYALVQQAVAKKLLQRLPESAVQGRTLEVGCGTGILSRKFLHQYPQADLVLSDLAHGMSCRVADVFDQYVVDADAASLPFQDQCFDLVLSSSVYQWVDHLVQGFAELQRVLRPKGQVVMALFGERTLYELRHCHTEAVATGISHSQGFPGISQVEEALAGLFDIDIMESRLEVEWHPGVPQLLRSLKAIGAQNASRNRPGGLASRRTMQRMYESYKACFGRDGQIPATYEVIYLRLLRC